MLEMGPRHAVGSASVRHLENIRAMVRRLAEEAGLHDPRSFADSWHILMKGSIVQAVEGDLVAATRAKSMARLLIDTHRWGPCEMNFARWAGFGEVGSGRLRAVK